jgi:cytochrome c peroxidase
MKYLLALGILCTSAVPCVASEKLLSQSIYDDASEYLFALPTLNELIEDFGYNDAQIELGRHLYFEERVSKDENISCASCHGLDTGGVDLLPTSVGHNGQVGGRNAPTVLNAVLNIEQFWDGRAPNLVEQAKGPVENPIEMANTRDALIETLKGIPGYVSLFSKAYPSQEDPITFDNFATAVAAFETTLLTPSRFDAFLMGDMQALSLGEKVRLDIFSDRGCVECHNGYNIGGGNYQRFGAVREPGTSHRPENDIGLAAVSGDPTDKIVYRVPTLRNIAETGPYFHTGSADRLEEAIQVMAQVQLRSDLSQDEVDLLIEFLQALTGELPDIAIPDPMPKPETAPDVPMDPEISRALISSLMSFGHPAGRDPLAGVLLGD